MHILANFNTSRSWNRFWNSILSIPRGNPVFVSGLVKWNLISVGLPLKISFFGHALENPPVPGKNPSDAHERRDKLCTCCDSIAWILDRPFVLPTQTVAKHCATSPGLEKPEARFLSRRPGLTEWFLFFFCLIYYRLFLHRKDSARERRRSNRRGEVSLPPLLSSRLLLRDNHALLAC